MYCPQCGARVRPEAKFCNKCGFNLAAKASTAAPSSPAPEKGDSTSGPSHNPSGPLPSRPSEPGGAAPDPGVHVSPASALSAAKSKLAAVPKSVLLGALVAAVAAAIAILAALSGSKVSNREFEQALRDGGTLRASAGTFDEASDLNVESLKITSFHKYEGQDAGLMRAWVGTDEVYEGVADVVLSSDSKQETATATCDFMKTSNGWQAIGSPDLSNVSWTPKQGPSEAMISKNLNQVLQMVSFSDGSGAIAYGSQSLSGARASAQLYNNADVSVTDCSINGNAAIVKLDVKKDGVYYTCHGTVTATFDLSNKGTWSLDSATADDDLKKVDFSALVGTWNGTVTDAEWYCKGAESNPATIKFTSYDASTGTASGTISCVAHYHKQSEAGADTLLQDEPFSVELTGSASNFSGNASINQDAGSASLSFSFNATSAFGNAVDNEGTFTLTVKSSGKSLWSLYADDTYRFSKAQ